LAAGDDVVDVICRYQPTTRQTFILEEGGREIYRVGFVDNEEIISSGRLARKAPRQLIVRGTCHVVSIKI
jgi:hypothetical protein